MDYFKEKNATQRNVSLFDLLKKLKKEEKPKLKNK